MKDFFGTPIGIGDIVVEVDRGYTCFEYAKIYSLGEKTCTTFPVDENGVMNIDRKRVRYPQDLIKKPYTV